MGEGAAPHCGGQSVCDAIKYSAQVREPHTCLGPWGYSILPFDRCRYAGTAGHDEPRRSTLARKRRRLASVFPWYHQTPQPSESIGTDVLPAHQQPTPQQAPLPLPAAAPEQRQYQHQRARSASDDAETSPAAPPRPPFLLSLPPVARPPAMIAPSRPCIPARAPPQPSSCQQGR